MSKNTKNYQLYTFTSDNDVADLKLLEHSFDTIDKGLVLDVGESSGSGNNYVLNLGSITLTSTNKGISFKFWAHKSSDGAVKINGTYNLVKSNGNPIKNLKANAPYTITYDGNKNFFLSSGGADESDSTTVGTDGSKVLEPNTFIGSDGEVHTGTMPNKGAVTATLNCGGSYTIPAGYHNGSGKVTANSLASQTGANAGAGDILSGKTAWVNGSKITGNMPNQGSITPGNSIVQSGDKLYCRMPRGAYLTNASSGYPEISYPQGDVAAALGLTANKIVSGSTIGGIAGTVTIQSLGGYTKSDIQNRGIVTRYKVIKQSEQALNLNGTSNNMYEVLQRCRYYVRDSGDKVCDVFYIDRNFNNLIFCKSKGTVSVSQNKDYYDFLQFVDFAAFKTTENTRTYLPYDQVGSGKKYESIPRTGITKYGPLVVNESRMSPNDSSGSSYCKTSTIRLQTTAMTYDLLTLDHYGWLFNYSASSDTFTTIVNKKGDDKRNHQYKTVYKIVPEVVDKNGNAI